MRSKLITIFGVMILVVFARPLFALDMPTPSCHTASCLAAKLANQSSNRQALSRLLRRLMTLQESAQTSILTINTDNIELSCTARAENHYEACMDTVEEGECYEFDDEYFEGVYVPWNPACSSGACMHLFDALHLFCDAQAAPTIPLPPPANTPMIPLPPPQ